MPRPKPSKPTQPAAAKPAIARPPAARPNNRRAAHHAIEEAKAELNRAEALRLRVSGLSEREIALRLGVSPSTAHDYIATALREVGMSANATRDQLREIETQRLEIAISAIMPYLSENPPEIITHTEDANGRPREITVERHVATMKAADTLVKLSARLAALHGLDAPAKVEQSGPGGGAIQVEHTFTPERQALLATRARALIEGLPKPPEPGPMNGEN